MPSTMIHLFVAHEVTPVADGEFWFGNFAPDYINERELKDKIHLRSEANRWDALTQLYSDIDRNDPFELGWFIHLFADACWDEKQIGEYRSWFLSCGTESDWFYRYREEIGLASYFLYHNLPWAKETLESAGKTKLDGISTRLPATPSMMGLYRDRVLSKHSGSDMNSRPAFFDMNKIESFVKATTGRYKAFTDTLCGRGIY